MIRAHVSASNIESPLIIFGAGPLPRTEDECSAHNDVRAALQRAIDQELLPKGTAYVSPERMSDASFKFNYDNQIEQEQFWLSRADVVLTWVGRDIFNKMLGLTTNFEVGERFRLPWFFMGGPTADKAKNNYLKERWAKLGRTWAPTIDDLVGQVVAWYARQKKEATFADVDSLMDNCRVPLQLRLTRDYGSWLARVRSAGNRLDNFEVLWTYSVGSDQRILLTWAAQVSVWVEAEKRWKSNEFTVSRRNYSSTVVFSREVSGRVRVLLVGEFRSPMGCMYWSVPAGSSFSPTKTPLDQAAEELQEETGVEIRRTSFRPLGDIPVMGVFAGSVTSLWSVEITSAEMDLIAAAVSGKVLGNEAETERTYPMVCFTDVLPNLLVDTSTLGLLFKAIYM